MDTNIISAGLLLAEYRKVGANMVNNNGDMVLAIEGAYHEQFAIVPKDRVEFLTFHGFLPEGHYISSEDANQLNLKIVDYTGYALN